jgi:hypothetical protein
MEDYEVTQGENRADKLATLSHLIVVMAVILGATILRSLHELDTPTLGTVYGAAMGYATGLTAQRGKSNGN